MNLNAFYVVQKNDIQMKRTNKTLGYSNTNYGVQFVYPLCFTYSLPAECLLIS